MSPGAAAAAGVPGTAAVVATSCGTSVQLPEKSAGACAMPRAASAAINTNVKPRVRIIINSLLWRCVWIRRIGRHVRISLHRGRELADQPIRDALHPWIGILHIGLFLRIRQQVEQSHQRLLGGTTGFR